MAEEHILLPRERYQRLLNKAEENRNEQKKGTEIKNTSIMKKTRLEKKNDVHDPPIGIRTVPEKFTPDMIKQNIKKLKKTVQAKDNSAGKKTPVTPGMGKQKFNTIKKKKKPVTGREDMPPGIPASSNFKNWIRF